MTSPSASTPPVAEPELDQVEQFLREALSGLAPDPAESGPRGRGRPRVVPALCLWGGLLVCVLRGFSCQLDLWRRLTWQGLWDYPRMAVTDQAIYDRLARAGTAPLEAVFHRVSRLLAVRLAPYAATELAPFARDVVA